jgi:hypothetical protein
MPKMDIRPAYRILTSLLIGSGVGFGMSMLSAAPVVKGYVMDVQMVPAVCAYDPLKSKKRKCLEGYSLNITGLYPETSTRDCTTNSSLNFLRCKPKWLHGLCLMKMLAWRFGTLPAAVSQ